MPALRGPLWYTGICQLKETDIDVTTPASETSATIPTTSPTTPETSATTPTTSPTSPTTSATSPTTSPADTPLQVPTRPITRSRAKKIQQEVHALLCEFQLNIDGNFELPQSCMLLLLRFSEEEDCSEAQQSA